MVIHGDGNHFVSRIRVAIHRVYPSTRSTIQGTLPVSLLASHLHDLDSVLGVFATRLVNLYTNDIEASLAFYRDLFDFVETFRTPREGVPTHVELQLNGFTLGLGTVEAAKLAHGVEAPPGSPAMVLVVWTDEVDTAHEELVAVGVPTVQPPHGSGNGNRSALLRDPDGNLVEIVAKRLES